MKFIELGGRETQGKTTALKEQNLIVRWGQYHLFRSCLLTWTTIISAYYSACSSFCLATDSFVGYTFVNRSGKTIKPGEIDASVGLLTRNQKAVERIAFDWWWKDMQTADFTWYALIRAKAFDYITWGKFVMAKNCFAFTLSSFFRQHNHDCFSSQAEGHDARLGKTVEIVHQYLRQSDREKGSTE